jgi:hypothetical protein
LPRDRAASGRHDQSAKCPCYLSALSLFGHAIAPVQTQKNCMFPGLERHYAEIQWLPSPCFLPVSREFGFRDRFASDCILSQPVPSLGQICGVSGKSRSGRRLAPRFGVSAAQSGHLHGNMTRFMVPVSVSQFPISKKVRRSGAETCSISPESGS